MTAACRKSPNTATPQSSKHLRSATGRIQSFGDLGSMSASPPLCRLKVGHLARSEKCLPLADIRPRLSSAVTVESSITLLRELQRAVRKGTGVTGE